MWSDQRSEARSPAFRLSTKAVPPARRLAEKRGPTQSSFAEPTEEACVERGFATNAPSARCKIQWLQRCLFGTLEPKPWWLGLCCAPNWPCPEGWRRRRRLAALQRIASHGRDLCFPFSQVSLSVPWVGTLKARKVMLRALKRHLHSWRNEGRWIPLGLPLGLPCTAWVIGYPVPRSSWEVGTAAALPKWKAPGLKRRLMINKHATPCCALH